MIRSILTTGLAAAVLALGGMNARAANVILPTTFDMLTPSGATTTVDDLEFSSFSYNASATPSSPSPTPASAITVSALSSAGEVGLAFSTGPFLAAANQIADYTLSYTVSTTDGKLINDAALSLGGFFNNGGSGSVSIGETVFNGPTATGAPISKTPFQVFTTPPPQVFDTTALTPATTTITVVKDITVNGGNNGAGFSFTGQVFSVVPEPTSMALLGIGLSGLFTVHRFLKWRSRHVSQPAN